MAASVRWAGGARVAAWPVLELVVTVAAQVVLTPLLLHRLGAQAFGTLVVVQTALLAAAALSLGASTGLLPVLSAALHRGDAAGARGALHWLFRRVAAMSALVLAVGATLAAVAGGRAPALAEPLLPLALAGLGWIVATELDNAAAQALKAHGRFDTAAQSEVAARLAQLGLVAALVADGAPALAPVAISLAVTVAKLVARLAVLRRLWLAAAAAPALAPRALVHDLAITGLWIWIGALGSLAFNAIDRWFVGAWFGASTLAAYAVCVQLTQLPHAVVAAAGQVLVPWATRLGAQGASHGLKVLALATALAALPSLLLIPLLEPLLGLWISPAFAQEHLALARGLAVAFLVLCLNVPGYFLLLGLGRARFATLLISACGALFVAGALLLPRELQTFVVLKGAFAVAALGLPLGCAWMLLARPRGTPGAVS